MTARRDGAGAATLIPDSLTGQWQTGTLSAAGLWSPTHEELLILDLGKSVREKTQKTLRHEAFHQYLFYATGGEHHAVWFNEGARLLLREHPL